MDKNINTNDVTGQDEVVARENLLAAYRNAYEAILMGKMEKGYILLRVDSVSDAETCGIKQDAYYVSPKDRTYAAASLLDAIIEDAGDIPPVFLAQLLGPVIGTLMPVLMAAKEELAAAPVEASPV